MWRSFVVRALTILCFVACFMGCSKDELTRDKAKKILDEAVGVEQKYTDLKDGEFKDYSFGQDILAQYDALASQGFISMRNVGYMQYVVTLNQSIEPYVIRKEWPSAGGMAGSVQKYRNAKVVLWKRKIGKITGIKTEQNALSACATAAEFDYEYDITPLGKLIGTTQLPTTGSACFSKYDDGWRLKTIDGGDVGRLEKVVEQKSPEFELMITDNSNKEKYKVKVAQFKTVELKDGSRIEVVDYTHDVSKFLNNQFKGAGVQIKKIMKDNSYTGFLSLQEEYSSFNKKFGIDLLKITDVK